MATLDRLLQQAHAALARGEYQAAHAGALQALQHEPRAAEPLFIMALIAAAHENHGKACEVFERAINASPRPEYFAQWGRSLLARQEPRRALEAALAGLALQPKEALTLDTLGVVLVRAGAHAEALAPFRLAVAAAPHNPQFQYNLGAALQFVGDLGGAAAAYRAALDSDPQHYRAWSALAQVSRQALTEQEEQALASRLERGELDPDAELHLCHALAKQREDQGRYGETFALLARGKKRKRDTLTDRSEDDRALFAAAEETAGLLERGAEGFASEEPIFIVGMPRTGTTLVERILSSHPDVFAAGELSHFALALKRATATPSAYVLDATTLRAAGRVDLLAVGRAYIDSTRPRTGHQARFIDKMPLNFLLAGVIRAALPKARIICLRRHPLDTCLSNYRQLFATGFSYYQYAYDLLDCGRYWLAFDGLVKQWKGHLGDRFIEVQYEQVVDDLESQARRLLDFVGLPWDPRCIEFHRNTAPVATASSAQVREPLYRRAVGRHQHYRQQLQPLIRWLQGQGVSL